MNTVGIHQRDVREVYYLCLALGFMGRYCHKGDEYLLERLKASNLKLLIGSSLGVPSLEQTDLFPEAFPSQPVETKPFKRGFTFSPVTIIGLISPILILGLLFLIYRFSLSGVAESFLGTVP